MPVNPALKKLTQEDGRDTIVGLYSKSLSQEKKKNRLDMKQEMSC
jgi:hypothetical protein